MSILGAAARHVGRIAGEQEVGNAHTEEGQREVSRQQVRYHRALKNVLRTEEMEDKFDQGYTEGIEKGRRNQS